MAAQHHVEDALLSLAADAIYPSGPHTISAIGIPCRLHRGWPLPAALDADLPRMIATIAVTSVDHSLRITTRYPDTWAALAPAPALLQAEILADQVRFSGLAAAGQLVGILADGATAVHRTLARDTPASVAAQLARQLRSGRIVQLSNAALTIPGVRNLHARVVADQPARREIRRQTQGFRISCFCPAPDIRDAASQILDIAIAGQIFLTLADASIANLALQNTGTSDAAQHALLYRRDIILQVEYATTEDASLPALLFGAGSVNAAPFIG